MHMHQRSIHFATSIAVLTLLFGLLLVLFRPAFAQTNAAGQPNRFGKGLGRLLTTEVEREKMDDIRFNVKAIKRVEAEEVKEPAQLHIDGISLRPERPAGKRVTIWLDNKPYSEDDLPYGLSLVRGPDGIVTGLKSVVSKGKFETAKIGEDITRPQTAAEAKALEQANIEAAKKPLESVSSP